MIRLYHFTCLEYVASIAHQGLWKGEFAVSRTDVRSAVNLTSSEHPARIGVNKGGIIPEDVRARLGAPLGARWPDKTRIRLSVHLDDDDPLLMRWREAAISAGATREWRRTLEKAAGGQDWKHNGDAWWLYFGNLAPSSLEMTDMETGETVVDWLSRAEAGGYGPAALGVNPRAGF